MKGPLPKYAPLNPLFAALCAPMMSLGERQASIDYLNSIESKPSPEGPEEIEPAGAGKE